MPTAPREWAEVVGMIQVPAEDERLAGGARICGRMGRS